jgi:hypothetical protein
MKPKIIVSKRYGGWEVSFKIDNQTFTLESYFDIMSKENSKENADFRAKMLRKAFAKLKK